MLKGPQKLEPYRPCHGLIRTGTENTFTIAYMYLQSVDANLISVGRRIEHANVSSLAMKTLPGKALQKCLHAKLHLNILRV